MGGADTVTACFLSKVTDPFANDPGNRRPVALMRVPWVATEIAVAAVPAGDGRERQERMRRTC